ncbi:TauD/TfdA dioxygenase family protein [Xylophilus sp.]|uniref:TauD/TfdA dioxygenase family protein n=1 Tax=Xylophilus sp. TaxID=2653893 RepID=UPI0013BB796F|nr:TauD/TfdA family dioxygenase [Xylophilus sp.]KAF1049156.1 MAG: Alpha-ketoglutarate-dependent taurine dioxygenase [Xylophilus sp.]
MTQDVASTVQVNPIAGHIGAEIEGVDLKHALGDEQVRDIRSALLRYKVIFFRNQDIDHAQQIAFTGRFGEVTYAHPHEDEPIPDFPQLLPIDRSRYEKRNGVRRASYESRWHTDVTAAVNPPAVLILRAVNVPAVGGDTTWTNLVAAYEGLPQPLKDLADSLKAEHRFFASTHYPADHPFAKRVNANPLVSIHPVVRVHPETGERALFVNPGFTARILDVLPRQSDRLLELFFEEITRPAYTTRFRWNNGDIAFWDNRATAHQAPTDLDHLDVERVLYRTTITGDIPVGVDGFRSQIVQGHVFGKDVPEVWKQRQEQKQASAPQEEPVAA